MVCPILTAAEGLVLGAKMFIIAGPVIVYGTVASVIYGIIYFIISLFKQKGLTNRSSLFVYFKTSLIFAEKMAPTGKRVFLEYVTFNVRSACSISLIVTSS